MSKYGYFTTMFNGVINPPEQYATAKFFWNAVELNLQDTTYVWSENLSLPRAPIA